MHQRSTGSAVLAAESAGDAMRIADLYQQGCAKVRLPKNHDGHGLEAVMINTAGGITGGDKLDWRFEAGRNCKLTVTSQACERLYRALDDTAHIKIELAAGSNARLNWLPQETILFDGCRTHRSIDVALEDNARLLVVEPLLFGRAAMGEKVTQGSFSDAWHIRHGGRPVHADRLRFDGGMDRHLQGKAVAGGATALATVLALETVSTRWLEPITDAARQIIGEAGGVSFWKIGETGKLLARLVAEDGYTLRKRLVPLIELLNDGAALPKSWAL